MWDRRFAEEPVADHFRVVVERLAEVGQELANRPFVTGNRSIQATLGREGGDVFDGCLFVDEAIGDSTDFWLSQCRARGGRRSVRGARPRAAGSFASRGPSWRMESQPA